MKKYSPSELIVNELNKQYEQGTLRFVVVNELSPGHHGYNVSIRYTNGTGKRNQKSCGTIFSEFYIRRADYISREKKSMILSWAENCFNNTNK